ncbi:MAG TPA: hypothetical protein VFZ46_03425 [Nitrososphaeraceae archaeon]
MIGLFTISILSIVVMLEEVNAEEEFLTQMTIFKDFIYNIPTTINNTLSDEIEPISFNSTIQTTEKVIYQDRQDSKPSLSVMINNALLGKIEPISFNSTALDNVKEQFITIKQDEYNENMIFEETNKKAQVLTTKVPFILPVPFP